MSLLSGAVALVTGGWRGIGRATVEQLRQDGARVAFSYLPGVEPVDEISAFTATDAGLSAHPLDLRDAGSIRACLAGVVAHWGGIDILVNNAAVGTATVAMFSDDPAVQDGLMLQINAAGTLAMCKGFVALPGTQAGRKVINVSSVGGGIAAFPGFSLSDGMSKAAVAHLTRQLAAEQVRSGIDVFAICPGATNTVMFQQSTLNHLTDVIGPRLTNSPSMTEANRWTRSKFTEWGLSNVHDEAVDDIGRGWSFNDAGVEMLSPRIMPLHALPKAWTPGTAGPVEGEAIAVKLAKKEDLEKWKGKLKGKVVFTDDLRAYKPNEKSDFDRHDHESLEELLSYPLPSERAPPGKT